jgi:eukaryotic-like serine/threonine-protein kinase
MRPTDGTVTDSTTGSIPELAGHYRIERELGAGGMATVYLAEDVRHRRKVAVKVLHPELSAVIGGDRFLKEIELTANLQHPHILPLFDSGSAGGLLYYVMPYVAGETLRGRLERERQLPISEALRIASEIGDAIGYAHRKSVVHRDIKPENILLQDGRVLIADFGIALAVQQAGGTRMTQTGMSLGTPQYMAPEQAMGDKAVDHRADIYALAALTYEMLTGEPPFIGPTSQAIVAKVLTTEPTPPEELRRTIPPHVASAVLVGLQKLPADRQPSAEEFVAELMSESAAANSRTRAGASARVPKTRKRFPIVTVLVALGAAGLGAAGGWLATPTESGRPPVRFVHQTDSTHFMGAGCCGYQLAISPDEMQLVYVGTRAGQIQLYSRRLDELEAVPIHGSEGAMEAAFSPDSRWIAFRVRRYGAGARSDGEYELRKVPSNGGAPVTIAVVSGWPYGATWMPDGRIIFAGDSVLYAVSADGGTPAQIGSPDSSYRYPSPLTGSSITFTRFGSRMQGERGGSTGPRIGVLDLATGRETMVGEGTRAIYTRSGHLSFTRSLSLISQQFDTRKLALTGSPMTLTDELSRPIDFDVSGGGVLVYQSGRGGASLDIVASGQSQTIPIPIDATHFDNPRISPDERLIAFAIGTSPGHQLLVHDLERNTNLRLTFVGGNHEYLAWAPDGRNIFYGSDSAIMIQPADRSGEERLVLSIPGRQVARISVGGRWLAFAARDATNEALSDIYLAALDAPEPRVYLQTRFAERSPALSPDGRWLAYVSDESGRQEVYASSVPVPGAREVISSGGGAEPVWSRDGRTLYYRASDGTVTAASVEGGATPQVSSRRVVLQTSHDLSEDAADYDAFADGKRFVMLRSTRVGAPLVVITGAFRRADRTR